MKEEDGEAVSKIVEAGRQAVAPNLGVHLLPLVEGPRQGPARRPIGLLSAWYGTCTICIDGFIEGTYSYVYIICSAAGAGQCRFEQRQYRYFAAKGKRIISCKTLGKQQVKVQAKK